MMEGNGTVTGTCEDEQVIPVTRENALKLVGGVVRLEHIFYRLGLRRIPRIPAQCKRNGMI